MIAAVTATFGSVVYVADGWHHGWGGPWFLLFPLFWGLVILGIVWIVRGSPPWRRGRSVGRSVGPRTESGIEILERRFAEGEIDLEEYRKRRSILDQEQR
jgi:putative membrane protein